MNRPTVHPAALESAELLAQCEVLRTRRSGPGGQHRNKVETAVVLTHRATGIRAEAGERRSQAENQRVALFRLRVKLAIAMRQDLPSPYIVTRLWQTRCRNRKILINSGHTDFPAMLAEALDIISVHDFDLKQAAETLQCTSSQLLKLLKLESRALTSVNQQRAQLGLRPLK